MTELPAMPTGTLLGPEDEAPFRFWAETAPSPFVLVSDHAGRAIPRILGDMGVAPADWERHIALDIGIRGVAHKLHERLGSAWVEQVYSRLVIDCNRKPGHPTSIPPVSDGTEIPANADVSDEDRAQREREILLPYHAEIERVLAERGTRPTFFISLHSFTPCMQNGDKRPWQIGLLHDHDPQSAQIFRALLEEDSPSLCIGDNEPYALTRQNDFTVPSHGESHQLPTLEIEIRQDLLADEAGETEWAERLARLLPRLWETHEKLAQAKVASAQPLQRAEVA